MSEHSHRLSTILTRPGSIGLSGNIPFIDESRQVHLSLRQQPSGHWIVYGPHGHRILFTDPDGHPLHECEWEATSEGRVRLVAARMFLDWDQWVGIKPSGLVNSMTMDLSSRPGWETLTRQDLRRMASQAMGLALEEVEFFYTDEDLRIDSSGRATIQQRKDAFYILEDGTFDHARFMSCMSAMHWEAIDYLPVVELFKSLLPGTGSATFELIRGLYDDQNQKVSRPLHYRGIPTYPSEAAFGLFSQFFTASFAGQESPFTVFMDTPRSHQVSWLPKANPPSRYVDLTQKACLTITQGRIHKVTVMDDPTGLPFSASSPQGFAPCGRTLSVKQDQLILQDRSLTKTLPVQSSWSASSKQSEVLSPEISAAPDWRTLFPQGVPPVMPHDAFSAVLLYPEDDSLIDEYASQPFIADFLDDLVEQDQQLASKKFAAQRILIHGFDAAIGTCVVLDQPRPHTVVYSQAALAQKQAQFLWNQLARSHRLDWLPSFRFLPVASHEATEKYDWWYHWIPFAEYQDGPGLQRHIEKIANALAPQGLAFLAGPESIPALVGNLPIRILFGEAGSELQPFVMHRSILPKSRLNPQLHIWCLQKM